jgi:hypothetical protein
MQGGGWVAEGGTVNVPIAPTLTHAYSNLKKLIQPFGISLEAMEDSTGSNSVISQVQYNLDKARSALAERMNVAMNGDGTGKLAGIASGSNLTWVMDDDTDWDRLYVGQVVDVLQESDGANGGNGKRRVISSITISTKTVVFDTAQQASDGESGNITAGSGYALYVPGSYGNVLSGGIEAAGRGTTFQGVTLATYPQFKAVDGRSGTTTSLPFSETMVDVGLTLGQRAGAGKYTVGIGDPNAINVYKNAKQNQIRYNVPTGTVAGRFSGVQIDLGNQTVTLVGERKHKPGSIKFVDRSAATLYASKPGPDYDQVDGGTMFKQFNRTTNYEVWLKFRPEWCWHSPNKILYFDNLAVQDTAG